MSIGIVIAILFLAAGALIVFRMIRMHREAKFRITLDASDNDGFRKLMNVFSKIKPEGATYYDTDDIIAIEVLIRKTECDAFRSMLNNIPTIEFVLVR